MSEHNQENNALENKANARNAGNLFGDYYSRKNKAAEKTDFTIGEYLELCAQDKSAYASAPERLLKAIGEPEEIDTRNNERLSRIFSNRAIQKYPAFDDFYGAEETIMQIVGHLKHAAQGLEESKQVLYLLGPVGGGKSSIAERLKELMEKEPVYTIAVNEEDGEKEISPINENPFPILAYLLGNGDQDAGKKVLENDFKIPANRLKDMIMSPWAAKRVKEMEAEERDPAEMFSIVKRYPSRLNQIAISKTEPGDENNQDISALVGKVDIRKLEEFPQNDPDAYSFSGGLPTGNRGIMEFVEMFKAPIKVLHPLLTATQEKNFNGTEAIGAIPFDGIILAHSNESEWETFRNNKNNEAFIDRVNIIKVPYCLQVTEEVNIYKKLIESSTLSEAPCAPGTLEMLAQFSVLSRLKDPENSNIFAKMKVYDGENIKAKDPSAKSIMEYRDAAGLDEGMDGSSTRFAFKTLSKVFNYDATEVAANPVHLMYILETQIKNQQLPKEQEDRYVGFIKEYLAPKFLDFIGKEIQTAYLESYSEYGQNLFERYLAYADFWLKDQDYRDPETGTVLDRAALDAELQKMEKPAGVSNPKEFRNDIVMHILRKKAENGGETPKWTSYEKIRAVIEKKMFANTEEMLPVLSAGAKGTEEERKKHEDFLDRMVKRGYTQKQTRLLTDYWLRGRKAQ